ncbi:hypothetical protein Aspvir_002411 [Aspergillus viridinutans]|uniref:MFS transporter n=1 Tax=Aspergillus viridinutans TaxID=75553 RepID=A0A9P3F9Y9_ASPVI|nr:uncharacterized protein Aspvir_002411 [Aspergillus viridinutans]GIK06760.1 hypothetical protein Aspvir_002411 [Aspergillus viridinutans]
MLCEIRHDECEETPLLGHDHPSESRRSTHARWILIVLSLGIIAINFGSYLAMAPQIQIFESIICRKLHPEIALLTTQEQIDARCKAPDMQGELALVNGWKETLDTLPGIFLALPFGLMADQAGRKVVLRLSLLGLIMEEVMVRIIAWYSTFIPLRTVWFMSLFQICGGGTQIARSMIFTMIADVFPVEKRANIFFIIYGSAQVSEIVASPLSAWLMSWTAWLPYFLGVLFFLCGLCASLCVPETLPKLSKLSETGSEDDEADDDAPRTVRQRLKVVWTHARHQIMHHSRFIFAQRNIVCISIALLMANVAIQSLLITLQYVSKRFSWSMAKASFLVSLKGIMNLTALLLILPALSKALDRFLPPIRRDLRISLGSVLTIAAGHVLMALAASPTVFAAGLSISSLGAGFFPALRSVATALVDEAEIGLLGTTIALTEGLGAIIAGPMMAGTFKFKQQVREIRGHILTQIPSIMHEFLRQLDSNGAVRIVGDAPNSILNPKDYFESIHPFASKVQHCVRRYCADYTTRFVAVNIYPEKHSYFVVDLNNTDYNYETAHKCKTPIPVYVLRLSKRAPTICRKERLDKGIAEMLADMHEGHGKDSLPLFEDHNDPNLSYPNPRSLQS